MVLVVILALSWFALSIPLALLVGRMLAGPPPGRRTTDLGTRLDELLV